MDGDGAKSKKRSFIETSSFGYVKLWQYICKVVFSSHSPKCGERDCAKQNWAEKIVWTMLASVNENEGNEHRGGNIRELPFP